MMMSENVLSFREPKMYTRETVFDFGQYKKETLGDVLKYDASYLIWLIENNVIDVDIDLMGEIEDANYKQGDDEDFEGECFHPDDPRSYRD